MKTLGTDIEFWKDTSTIFYQDGDRVVQRVPKRGGNLEAEVVALPKNIRTADELFEFLRKIIYFRFTVIIYSKGKRYEEVINRHLKDSYPLYSGYFSYGGNLTSLLTFVKPVVDGPQLTFHHVEIKNGRAGWEYQKIFRLYHPTNFILYQDESYPPHEIVSNFPELANFLK